MRRVSQQDMRVIVVVVIRVGITVRAAIPNVVIIVSPLPDGVLAGEFVKIAGVARIVTAAATRQSHRRQDR